MSEVSNTSSSDLIHNTSLDICVTDIFHLRSQVLRLENQLSQMNDKIQVLDTILKYQSELNSKLECCVKDIEWVKNITIHVADHYRINREGQIQVIIRFLASHCRNITGKNISSKELNEKIYNYSLITGIPINKTEVKTLVTSEPFNLCYYKNTDGISCYRDLDFIPPNLDTLSGLCQPSIKELELSRNLIDDQLPIKIESKDTCQLSIVKDFLENCIRLNPTSKILNHDLNNSLIVFSEKKGIHIESYEVAKLMRHFGFNYSASNSKYYYRGLEFKPMTFRSPSLNPDEPLGSGEFNPVQKEYKNSNDDTQQNSELESLRNQVQDHSHYIVLMKARSVQCISAFSKFNNAYMHKETKAVLKLDNLLEELNRVLPSHMKHLDRTELLEATRQLNEAQNLGIVWRKSNSDFVCDGWIIRRQELNSIREQIAVIQRFAKYEPLLRSLTEIELLKIDTVHEYAKEYIVDTPGVHGVRHEDFRDEAYKYATSKGVSVSKPEITNYMVNVFGYSSHNINGYDTYENKSWKHRINPNKI